MSPQCQLFLANTIADRFNLLLNDTQFSAGNSGELVTANCKTFPALVSTGSNIVISRVKPYEMNTFHVYPRSAELQLVIQGRLVIKITPENGVLNANGNRRVIRNGLIHTQFNPDCTNIIFITSFASKDFSTGQILNQTFTFINDTIAGENINAQCLQQCGIKKRRV
ncbi:hypothetical protein QBC46DRAFT_366137 [Diplogelasinospora grovesii]|uniref:Cupin type-1 domain-containing protein n=1 Tax=Diplogelasinospora grovesii TaxID=303347 RepID=A0AAN6S1Z5_9PEZI|nr:hypothetical protein QBC46DRAFT_366137 [Diplogelasinospora grovesii]